MVWKKDPSPIVLPTSVANACRYNFALIHQRQFERPEIYRLIRNEIEKHFNVSIVPETRMMDVRHDRGRR